MSKRKSHKGTKKVLKVRVGGTIKRKKTGTNHNTGKKSANSKRKKRIGGILSQADKRRISNLI